MTPLVLLLMSLPASAATPRLPPNALRVPLVRQATSYSCGAAALLSLLFYWQGYDGREDSLYKELGTTPKDGTPPESLIEAAARRGLEARLVEHMSLADLRDALQRGDTVILDIQAWRDKAVKRKWSETWEDGHYVVLVGMDKENAYVMDPSSLGAYGHIPLSELPERWHDYENRHGIIRRYHRLGIVIRGTKPPKGASPSLVRVE